MSGSSSLRRRIEALEKALADRERPPFVVVLVGDGEALAEALGRHPEIEHAVFAAAISTDYHDDQAKGEASWRGLADLPPIGRA